MQPVFINVIVTDVIIDEIEVRIRIIELVAVPPRTELLYDKVEEVLKWNTQLNTWKIKRSYR